MIGFEDRFTGMQEKSFEAFEWGEVSEHRIYYFKFRGKVVWDRRGDARLDLVFGSQDGCSSIYDLLHLPKVPPPGPTEEELELEARAEQQRLAKEKRRRQKATPLAVPGAASASAPPPRPGMDPSSVVAHYTSILYAPPAAARPNFFVAWRLVNEELTGRLHEVQHATQAQSHDLPDAALIPPGALHISMAFLRITTTAELQAAACVMKKSIPKLLAKHMPTRKASTLKFAGLGMFGARVLYTSPDERRAAAQQRLFDLQLDIEQEFVSSGLQVTPIARFWDPKSPSAGVSHHNGFAPHVSIVRVTPRTSALGNEAGAADGSGAVKGDVRVPTSAVEQGTDAGGAPKEWGEDSLRGLYLCSMNAPMGVDGFYTHVARVSHPAFEAKAAPAVQLPPAALAVPGLKKQASLPDILPPITQLLKQTSAMYAADEISADERSALRETIMSAQPPQEAVSHLVQTLGTAQPKHSSSLLDCGDSPLPAAAGSGAGAASPDAAEQAPPSGTTLPPLPEPGVPPSSLFPRKADSTAPDHKLHELHAAMGASWLVKASGGTGMLRLEKILVVLRGIPGAGKSSTTAAIAQHLLSHYGPAWQALGGVAQGATGKTGPPMAGWGQHPPLWVVASADNFFVNAEGKYVFDQSRIGEAHSWCKRVVSTALKSGVAAVIVDNTGTRLFEYGHYLSEAARHAYGARVAEIACPNESVARIFAARNSHGVPEDKVLQMWQRWEGRAGAAVVRPYGVEERLLLPERGSDAWQLSVSVGTIDPATGWLAPLGTSAAGAGSPSPKPSSPQRKSTPGKKPAPKHLKRAYFAAFLTHASRRQLLAACPPKFRDRVAAEHMTIQFSPAPELFAHVPLGARVQLQLGKVYSNDNVQSIVVQASGCGALQELLAPVAQSGGGSGEGWEQHGISSNAVPHITVSISEAGRAADSNALLSTVGDDTTADADLGAVVLDAVVGLAVPPSPSLIQSLGAEPCVREVSDFTVSGAFVITSRSAMGLPALPAHLSGMLPAGAGAAADDEGLPDAPEAAAESVSIQSDSSRPFLLADAQTAPPTTLFVFDFDGTLFLTPGPGEGKRQYEAMSGSKWERAGWLQHPESLQAPMKVFPGPALPAFRLHKNVAGSRSVVLTARHIATGNAVRAVCQQGGVQPDAFIFNRTGAPGPQYKINAICLQLDELAAQHAAYAMATGHPLQRVQRVVIWEDDKKCIAAYAQVAQSRGAPTVANGPAFEIINVANDCASLSIPVSLESGEDTTVEQPLSYRAAQAAMEKEAADHAVFVAASVAASAAGDAQADEAITAQLLKQVQATDSPLMLQLAREGMLRTPTDTCAAEDALDALTWSWSQVLRSHFNMPLGTSDAAEAPAPAAQRPPLLGYVFGSYPLGKAGCDVDLCLLCPDSLAVPDAVQLLTSLLQRAKLTSKVYASQTARIPRLAVSVPHPNAPDVEMDIVFVPVRGTALAATLRVAAHTIEAKLPKLVRIVDGSGDDGDAVADVALPGSTRAPLPPPFASPRDAAELVQGSLHKGHGASITSALFSQAVLEQLAGVDVQPTAASSGGSGRAVPPPAAPAHATHAAIAPLHFAAALQWVRQLLQARWMSGSVFSCVRSYHLVLVLSSLVGTRARGVDWPAYASAAEAQGRRLYASPDALLVDFLQQAVLMGYAGWSMVVGDRVPSQAIESLVQLWIDTAEWMRLQPASAPAGVEQAALHMAKQCGVPSGKGLSSVAISAALTPAEHIAATTGFGSPTTTLLHELQSAVPPLPSPGQALVVIVYSCESPRLAWQLQHIVKARLATALRTVAHNGFHVTPGLEDVPLSTLLATLSVPSLVGPMLNSAGQPMRSGEPHSLDDARVTGHTHTTALMARDALFRVGLECTCLSFSVRRSKLGLQAVKAALAELPAWIAPVQAVAEQDGVGTVKVRVRIV